MPRRPITEEFKMIARCGPPALAWEVLRRQPDYRDAYKDVAMRTAPGVATDAEFVANWGLHFR
jgi:hypothetical protein